MMKLQRLRCAGALALSAVLVVGCTPEGDFTKAPLEIVDESRPAPILTNVYVAAPTDAAALGAAVEEAVPTEMVKVRQWVAKAACVQRGNRRRCGNVLVEGGIRRAGAATFEAAGRSFIVRVPLSYAFELSGSGPAGDLADTVTGTIGASAEFDITLAEGGRIEVSRSPRIAYEGATKVAVFDGSLDLTGRLKAGLESRLKTLGAELERAMDPSPARELLAEAWRQLHYPVRVAENEELWLRGAPRAVHFAGLLGSGSSLGVRFGIETPMTTFEGERPLPLIPLALPDIQAEPTTEIGSRLTLPARLGYERLAERLAKTLPVGTRLSPQDAEAGRKIDIEVGQHRLFPAGGRLGLELSLEVELQGDWSPRKGRAYMVGLPRANAETGRLELAFAEYTAPVTRPDLFVGGRFVLPEEPIREAFASALDLDPSLAFSDLLSDAADRFTVGLGAGLLLKGTFERIVVERVQPGQQALELTVVLVGDLMVSPARAANAETVAAKRDGTTQGTAN
ncbi:MAG: DUF4403 family protein [Rhizobiales bacterium]|nr:DUF4403 family protein [Hyphomicrobiales bacterium]